MDKRLFVLTKHGEKVRTLVHFLQKKICTVENFQTL